MFTQVQARCLKGRDDARVPMHISRAGAQSNVLQQEDIHSSDRVRVCNVWGIFHLHSVLSPANLKARMRTHSTDFRPPSQTRTEIVSCPEAGQCIDSYVSSAYAPTRCVCRRCAIALSVSRVKHGGVCRHLPGWDENPLNLRAGVWAESPASSCRRRIGAQLEMQGHLCVHHGKLSHITLALHTDQALLSDRWLPIQRFALHRHATQGASKALQWHPHG